MLKHLLTIGFLSVGLYSLHAQSTAQEEVAKAIEQMRLVMIDPDSTILHHLASDDLVYVHSSGTVRDKQGFIDEFMKGWTMLSGATINDQTITISNDIAIVRHQLIGYVDKPDQAPQFDILILMVWRKEAGEWKLLARQAAKVP